MSNQWISVDDRMPNVKDYCLTLAANDDVEFAVYTQDRDGSYFASIDAPICDKYGYDNDGQYGEIINITHWALMPQLPNLDENQLNKHYSSSECNASCTHGLGD